MTANPSPSPAGPPRKSFALAGHSITLDPRTHAVRRDLADIRLAERVFAPHYAAPVTMKIATVAALRKEAASDSTVIGTLAAGDLFEVLEFAGSHAWGIAPLSGLVGYVVADMLCRP